MKYEDNPEKEKRKLAKNNFVIKGNATKYRIWFKIQWPKNCSSFESEPQIRFIQQLQTDLCKANKTIVQTMLDQVTVLDFQVGSDLSNEQFLYHYTVFELLSY